MKKNSVGVFLSSSQNVSADFFLLARELGFSLARAGFETIYGGCSVGMMGELARSAQGAGGRVVGIVPKGVLSNSSVVYQDCDELIFAEDLRERKALLERRSQAFVVLPGGFGTFDELFEMLDSALLGVHEKPIIILNWADFYGPLLQMFDRVFALRFASEQTRHAFQVTSTVGETLRILTSFAASKQCVEIAAGRGDSAG